MTTNFSTAATETLELAQRMARRLQHREVGSGHLVVALFHNGFIRELFPDALDLAILRGQLREVVGPGDFPGRTDRPFAPELQAVLGEADKAAARMDHEYVWPEHLLLAATSVQTDGFRILMRSGGDPDEVAKHAIHALKNNSLTKEPMELNIVDTSIGTKHLNDLITRTARVIIPRDHQPGREVILQAVIVSAPLEKDCRAVASVLNDQFIWTELLTLSVSELREKLPVPGPDSEIESDKLTELADDLLVRATRILGA